MYKPISLIESDGLELGLGLVLVLWRALLR
jgi:hypothetical protein